MHLHSLLRSITLARPAAIYLLALPIIVFAWSLLARRESRRILAPLMRAIAIALFVLAFAAPEKVTHSQGAARPVAVDVSASITPAMRQWTAHLLRDDLKLRRGDPALMFGTHPEGTTVGGVETASASDKPCDACGPGATNLESALYSMAADPNARGGPAVIVTDGWQNRGDADRAVPALLSAQVRLDIFTPPGARSIPNVMMTELTLPPALEKAEPFALGITMENLNDAPVAGTIKIARNDVPLAERKVTIGAGKQRFDFPVRTEAAGLASYRAEFKADDPKLDAYLEDDSLQGWVGVGSQRKILILTDTATDAKYLDIVVRRLGFEPTVIPIGGGQWGGSLGGYDAVLINNVPAERLSPAVQSAMVSYVDRGGSLAMIGGDLSFGLGGYGQSPVEKVMPVIMKPPQHKERSRALVLVIDKSGSMGRNDKLEYAKRAAETVMKTLKDSDLVGVIGFDSQPFVVVPLGPLAKSRPYFDQMISQLVAHGTTYLLPALREAERTLAASGAQSQHVVILTDGETGGTTAMYYDLVSRMHRDGGATISTIAVGREANTGLLQAISQYGGGAYYQTDSPQNLPELFVEDFKQHGGQSTMVESDFTPHTVSPDPILKDLAGRQLPALKGYVSTEIKPRATMSMYVDRAGTHEPVIASWKYGAGKALAVTTDASGRWSSAWVRGSVFSPLWDRLLGWMTPQTAAEQKIDVALGYNSGRINVKLTDYGIESAATGLVRAIVTRPDGTRVETAINEEVPGEHSGSIEAPLPGTYYIEIKSPSGAKSTTFPPLAYTVSPAVKAELPRPEPNYGLLEHLSSATGGRLNPSASEVALVRPTLERRESLHQFLIVIAMLLLMAEALVRRVTS